MEDKDISSNRVITIHKVKTLDNQIQAQATISVSDLFDNVPFNYLISLNSDTDSEISAYIKEKIKSGEVELLPPDVSKDEAYFNALKSRAESLIKSTDQFMTIDTELTDDEVKEMKSYRASLRNIVKTKDYKSLSKSGLPELPKFLKKDAYDIYYVGTNSLEK